MAPRKIAVIGCGPSGMSFCHAVETMVQKAQAAGDSSLDELVVTCFERSSRPGGVWKAADTSAEINKINMYDALWTNGPSHCFEFEDYTFDEHFGRPMTVYMSRHQVLGYMIGRCTKNCPHFFEKYAKFNSWVENVKYDEDQKQFCVTVRHEQTEQQQHMFDKVVWACGDNGKQTIPGSLQTIFNDFSGRFIHSSDTAKLENDVKGKRVLLIGGGYSAEDLALQAVKLGVEKVYISTREHDSCGTVTTNWPENKVVVLREEAPVEVVDGHVIKFKKPEWRWDTDYTFPSEEYTTVLDDIDTVICCTGYNLNFDMLSEECRPDVENDPVLQVPDDWTMPENNMTKHVGEVKPGKTFYYTDLTYPELYQGVLVKNPGMMFVWTYDSDFPLVGVDTSAWLLASYCTGNKQLPSREEMERLNQEKALAELTHPWLRYYMDENYHKALMALPGWDGWDMYMKEWHEWVTDTTEFRLRYIASLMRAGDYPINIGTFEKLNERGRTMLEFDELSYKHRVDITAETIEKQPWRTFRDYENASKFFSLNTGSGSVPLSERWMETKTSIHAHDEEKKNSN